MKFQHFIETGRGKGELVDGAFGEPEFEFVGGGFGVGAAVNKVVFDGQGHVAADGAGFGFDRVGRPHHHADGFGGVGARNCKGDDRAADKVVDNIIEEGPLAVLGVVSFDGFAGGIDELETSDFEASKFDAANDFTVEVAGDSAGLDENQSCFHDWWEVTGRRGRVRGLNTGRLKPQEAG